MKQYLPGDKEEEKEQVDEFGPSAIARARKFVYSCHFPKTLMVLIGEGKQATANLRCRSCRQAQRSRS